jgi:precorrin-6B methylase 2
MEDIDIPFVPSSPHRLSTMLRLARIKPGEKSLDVGSGDGKVVISCARLGAFAHGFELSQKRVTLSRQNIADAGLSHMAFIHHTNFWDEDFSDFDLITVYGITGIMKRLGEKIKTECSPACRVVSNAFTIPHWLPVKQEDGVYLYLNQPTYQDQPNAYSQPQTLALKSL